MIHNTLIREQILAALSRGVIEYETGMTDDEIFRNIKACVGQSYPLSDIRKELTLLTVEQFVVSSKNMGVVRYTQNVLRTVRLPC